ncbi:MAG: hypothetical protein M1813_006407 [Trichoglossum hirsutum]|nr:MAG: hypothetical protein M1813_006407 [Trichoglossum hirsutum]
MATMPPPTGKYIKTLSALVAPQDISLIYQTTVTISTMHTHLIILAAAFISSSFAAIDPLTVTSVTPEQSSAINQAVSSLVAPITTDPVFSSIIRGLATDKSASSVLNEFLAQPTPTGSEGRARFNSIVNKMPPDAQSYFRSFTAAEASIESRILNSESAAGGSNTSTTKPGGPAVGSANMSTTATTTASTSSSNQTISFATSTLATYSSSAVSSIVKQNVGALVESEGLGLVLVILGMGIAVL